MTRLSSSYTSLYRYGGPISMFVAWTMLAAQGANISGYIIIVLLGSAAYTTWYGWRLSELWLDGDTLVVKGLQAFRVPLSEVLLLDTGSNWWMRRGPPLFVLGLNHPVGKVQKIRFLPAKGLNSEKFRVFQAKFRTSRSPAG